MNIAGIPWTNVQALRRLGFDAQLVVFNRGTLHPEADWSLERRDRLHLRLAEQLAAQARLLKGTDVFHFYFGLTLIPKALQFPLLRLTRKKSVFHYLGSDIRGKTPEELAYGKRADAQIVGSYDALRWVPEAFVVPPGLDLSEFEARPPSDNPRPLVVHAPSNRDKKGTRYVIEACEQLDVDLEIVEGLHHLEARKHYARADIVVDQLNAGWHGVFALEAMALGKPVVAHLKPDVIEKSAEGFGVRVPIVPATKDTLADALRPLVEDPGLRRSIGAESRAYVEAVHDADVIAMRLADIYAGLGEREPAPKKAAPAATPPGQRRGLQRELARLTRHTAIYGIGGLVSRVLAVILLPLYTHYLPPNAYGQVEIITAATAVLAILLQLGISNAFFRFYFDTKDPAERLVVIRTSFWFTMTAATLGLALGLIFASPVSHWLGLGHHPSLVRAGAVGLWAQTNYTQLTALFRAEERSLAYALASVANVLITVVAMVLFVAVAHWGAVGLVVGNFVGTLCVYFVLLAYRSEQLGLQFDTTLFRQMQKFGMPLVPSALALWAINFIDREFVSWYRGNAEVGVYSVAIKVASVITFAMIAFRTAWPAFAYSIEDDREARRTYSFVLTYLLLLVSWLSLFLGGLSPWLVHLLSNESYQRAERGVAPLAFGFAIYAAYTVLAIGSGRARKTQFNWVVTGIGAAVNIGLNFWLIPKYGFIGAAVSTAVAYTVLFVAMTFYAQRVYPVPHQWRRNVTVVAVAVGLTVAARAPQLGLAASLALVVVYPLALAAAGFYQRDELDGLRQLRPLRRLEQRSRVGDRGPQGESPVHRIHDGT